MSVWFCYPHTCSFLFVAYATVSLSPPLSHGPCYSSSLPLFSGHILTKRHKLLWHKAPIYEVFLAFYILSSIWTMLRSPMPTFLYDFKNQDKGRSCIMILSKWTKGHLVQSCETRLKLPQGEEIKILIILYLKNYVTCYNKLN